MSDLEKSESAVSPEEGFVVEARDIVKAYPGVRALRGVDLTLKRGEVLAVVGENGAGKSTLMKVLAGVETQTSGTVLVEGADERLGSVDRALELGISLVHQELNLCDNLSIADNVFLGSEIVARTVGGVSSFLRVVDQMRTASETEKLLQKVGLYEDPATLVRDLSIGSQQLVEIAKAISINAKVVIFDEPTSSLSGPETERLFAVIRDLKTQGIGVIYISHRLGEVKEIADRVMILRDGLVSGELSTAEVTREAMIRLMVGRDIDKFYQIEHKVHDTVRLEIRDFVVPHNPGKRINLKVHAGEVLVLAGLVGAGRTELLQTLFGIDSPLGGTVLVDGTELDVKDPIDAIRAGMLLVPEDRKLHGLITEMDIKNNVSLPGMKDLFSRYGVINEGQVEQNARNMIEKLDIRLYSTTQLAQTLSGGNQQKVVLGKWLSMKPRVLLLDEPTRGIDVMAKEEVYRLMKTLAENDVAMLVVSSEMQEVLSIADRIVVMCEGTITGELTPEQFSEQSVMRLATATMEEETANV